MQTEKQNDEIFSNEPGILFSEQAFVGRWSANRAARDEGPLQTMFLESALEGVWSLEEELEDLFSKENR